MCGIAGFVNRAGLKADRGIVRAYDGLSGTPGARWRWHFTVMNIWRWASSAHQQCGVAGGAQPLCNEDGAIWVTYNGELYNDPAASGESSRRSNIIIAPHVIPRPWFTFTKRRVGIRPSAQRHVRAWRSGIGRRNGSNNSRARTHGSREATLLRYIAGRWPRMLVPSPRRSWRTPRSAVPWIGQESGTHTSSMNMYQPLIRSGGRSRSLPPGMS